MTMATMFDHYLCINSEKNNMDTKLELATIILIIITIVIEEIIKYLKK